MVFLFGERRTAGIRWSSSRTADPAGLQRTTWAIVSSDRGTADLDSGAAAQRDESPQAATPESSGYQISEYRIVAVQDSGAPVRAWA
jgi:hypothetical protein